MDVELKATLNALVEGQTTTNDRLDKTNDRLEKLTEHVSRSAALINALAEGQALLTKRVENLAEGQVQVVKRFDSLTARIDTFNETVLRANPLPHD